MLIMVKAKQFLNLNQALLINIYFIGKTTLADMLLSSNGIISNRMAGKVRNKFILTSFIIPLL